MKTYAILLSPASLNAVQGLDCVQGFISHTNYFDNPAVLQGPRDGLLRALAGLVLAQLELERTVFEQEMSRKVSDPQGIGLVSNSEAAERAARRAGFALHVTVLKLAAELASY